MTELKVTLKHQFRAIQWTGENYDEVCDFFGFKPRLILTDELVFTGIRFTVHVKNSEFIVVGGEEYQVFTTEQFHERYEVVQNFDLDAIDKTIDLREELSKLRLLKYGENGYNVATALSEMNEIKENDDTI